MCDACDVCEVCYVRVCVTYVCDVRDVRDVCDGHLWCDDKGKVQNAGTHHDGFQQRMTLADVAMSVVH